MSSNLLGGLGVELYADLARLRQDMAEARKTVDSGAVAMRAAADMAAKALGALGIGLSVGAFAKWIGAAIEAADATKAFSEKAGVAAGDVAGLQLAFKQGGVGSDELVKGLGKLQKEMVEGNKAFDQLGVKTRNADGSMRSVKDVLYDAADAFSGMEKGALKGTLAQELFSKSGLGFIATLNEGSEGLREMAEFAERVGYVIDSDTAEAADRFNDNLGLLGTAADGMARTIAKEMLPTLGDLSEAFLGSATSSDYLKRVAEGVGTALRVLAKGAGTAGLFVVEVVSSIVKSVGAAGAAITSLLTGDFAGAKAIGSAWLSDMKADWVKFGGTVVDVWTGAKAGSNQMTDALGGTTAATIEQIEAARRLREEEEKAAKLAKAAAEAARKQREERQKLAQAGTEYLVGLDKQLEGMRREINLGRELTEGEKEQIKLAEQLAKGKFTLTAAERASAEAKLREMDAVRQQRAAQEELLKTMAAVAAHASKLDAARASETEKLREAVLAQREQNETLGLSAREIAERTARSYEASAAEKEWQAAIEGGNWQLEEQARLLRDRAQLTRDGVVLQEAKAAADEWKKVSDQIGQGLTDSLYRAFESGKGFFSTLWAGIKNTFKVTTLRLGVDVVMNPIKAAIGSLLGMPGLASAGGAAGGAGGVGGLGSLLGSLGSFGSGLGAGFGALFGEAGLTGAVDAGLTALGAGNIGGGLGTLAGSLGPYALGAMAIYTLAKKLDKSGTPHTGSVVAANASGLSTVMGDASQITNNLSSDVDAALRAASAGSTGTLNALASAFGLQGGYQSLAKFASDATDPSIGQFSLWNQAGTLGRVGTESEFAFYDADPQRAYGAFVGDVTRITRSALASMGLPDWALAEVNKLGAGATLDDVAALAAQLIQAKKDRDAPAAATGETADSWARSTIQYDSRSVDLLQSANDRLQAVSDAAARGAAAGEAHLAASQAGFTQLIERVERLAAAIDDMARPARLATLAEG